MCQRSDHARQQALSAYALALNAKTEVGARREWLQVGAMWEEFALALEYEMQDGLELELVS